MSTRSLQEARLAEYRQRRAVELLRQQLYAQPDPSSATQLSQALADAEDELRRLTEKRRKREPADQGLLLTTGQADRPGGSIMGAQTTHVDAQVLLRMSHVPTGIVHLLDPGRHPLVTFKIKYTGDEYVRLRLTSFVEGYSAHAVSTIELFADQEAEIGQLPTFFPGALEEITELTRATLHILIDNLDAKTEQESTFPIWLLARSSAYNGIEDPATGKFTDLSAYYAAWVTPNAAEVMQLLRRAAELHPRRTIVGYQVDKAGVEAQVRAIFEALKAEGIVYVNSILTFGAGKGEYMQRVRLPRESLATKSANCVDGTVLMASLLEAASLNPALVFVPGHAFVAWETQDGNGQWDYLETTMISTHDFEAAQRSGRAQAQHWEQEARTRRDPNYFLRLALPQLRAIEGITPME